jgi:hypothetical protein
MIGKKGGDGERKVRGRIGFRKGFGRQEVSEISGHKG